jgi:hypothetical protein
LPAQEMYFQLQMAMHEFGDKKYETMLMNIDDITAETTTVMT